MNNHENIDIINEEVERRELLKWIPSLMKDKLNILTTKQLRIIHYVLGYDCNETDQDSLIEEFEGYGYGENIANDIVATLERDGYLILEKPY